MNVIIKNFYFTGTTGGANNYVPSKKPEAEVTDDALESIQLRHQLEKCNHEIVELKAHIDRQKLQERNYAKEKNDIINERNELLKLLYHKNNVIERMSSDIKLLETQLKSTVSAKFDALIRLNATEGNGETLLFKEAISEIRSEGLSRELDSTRQKFQNEQDQCRNEIPEIDLSSGTFVKQTMDEPIEIHSAIMQETENDAPITNQSNVSNIRTESKSPDAKKVKVNGTSELNSSFQGETAKSTENYENGHLVGSSASDDYNMTVEENKYERALEDMDINVVPSQNQSQNIQLDLLSEVRTRGQNQFLRDAFRR